MKKRILSLILTIALCSALVVTASANNSKLVALTFDDGPHWKYTPALLDALAERNVKATFFLVGYSLSVNMDLAKRAFEDGHQLANHSYNHVWFSKTSIDGIRRELDSTGELLKEITGQESYAVRVPYGDLTSTVKKTVEAPLIQWSVDPTNGSVSASEYSMYNNMMRTVKDGSIILLHDTSQKNLNVAIKSIDALLEQGYEFVTLDELFRLRGISPENGIVYYNLNQGVAETAFDESRLESHWAYTPIQTVMEKELMVGDNIGFQPNQYLTRAMASTILLRLANTLGRELSDKGKIAASEINGGILEFEDVPDGEWFAEAATWAHHHGYFEGISPTRFDPYSYITKEQCYAVIARFAAEELGNAAAIEQPVAYRDDARTSPWADESVKLIRSAGFFSQNDREIFRPGDYMTRAEAAELFAFVLDLIEAQTSAAK